MEIVATENADNSNDVPVSDSEIEIEFGQVKHSQPAIGLRPDRDRHFSVTICGEYREGDLPIFVDMDVLRDMESHARENTRVELGGVMLGRHHLDERGDPFVVISESLRARHYEATKGSFKFTHETWSQITQERNEFRSDLEMVGWYHTHPGWGVFLSGMDLFICNHFFNRPLDVALVIDPCAGDRGWFQWSETEPGRTRQTRGFHLMTNRHRRSELNYFASAFSGQNDPIRDPRFHQAAFFNEPTHPLEDTMINLVDNRRPVFEFAIVSMLLLQLLVVGLIGWRLTDSNRVVETDQVSERLSTVEDRLASDEQQRSATIRELAYAEILDVIVADETGQGGLVEKYAEIATQNRMLNENLAGQLSRVQQTADEKNQLSGQLSSEMTRATLLEKELRQTNKMLELVKQDRDAVKSELGDGIAKVKGKPNFGWILYTLGGLALLAIGGIAGFFLNRMLGEQEDELFAQSPSARTNEPEFETRGKASKLRLDTADAKSEVGSRTD